MKNLSVAQSYLMCVLKDNGKLPTLSIETPVCLVAAGIIDLLLSGSVTLTGNKLSITDKLAHTTSHLKTLYYFIQETQPITLEKVASEYSFSLSNKRFTELLENIGDSLTTSQYVISKQGGLLGNSKLFIPDSKEVAHVIQAIKTDCLEVGTPSEEVLALTGLLEKSNTLKHFFSKAEIKQLRECIKDTKKNPINQLVNEMLDYITVMIAIIAIH